VSSRSSRSSRAEVAAALCSSPAHWVARAADAPTQEAATLSHRSASGARIRAAAASTPLRHALRRRTPRRRSRTPRARHWGWRCGLRRGAPDSSGVAASDRGALGPGPVGHGQRREDTGRLYGVARQQCRPGQPIRVRRVAAWPLTGGPTCQRISNIRKTQKFPPSQEK
jgi:hypothetical protein